MLFLCQGTNYFKILVEKSTVYDRFTGGKVEYIIKVFLYLILAVMTLIRWLLKIPMMLGNILLYFLSIIFILTGILSYGFALESARECGRMIIIGMAFGAIPDFVPFLGKSLETLVAKLLSMTNE